MRTLIRHVTTVATVAAIVASAPALAADVNRKIVTEIDPVAPASAAYEEQTNGVTTSKWGGNADFNLAGVMSTGPEFWSGAFVVKGPDDPNQTYRREDFWPGETQKLDAIRLRWNVTKWEQGGSMRGWFLKAGYSYLRINSRAKRYNEEGGIGDALPANVFGSPDDETDLITDIRHGIVAGFGNRWILWDQKLTITLGASVTGTFKRTVTVESKDPNARADYDHLIADLPDTKMSVRPTPEANLGLGWAW